MSNLQTQIASLEALVAKANALPSEKKIQESKSITPSTSSQTVQPDSGYDGLGKVTINAMPTGSVGTPSINIDANGKITATAAVDAGYVDGTDKTGTKTMTTQAAKTVTPTKSSQTAVAKNVYTTGVVTVGAIPDKYQDVSGVTATAARVAAGDKFVDKNGVAQTGLMITDKVQLVQNLNQYLEGETNVSGEKKTVAAVGIGDNYRSINWNSFGTADPSKVLAGSTFAANGYYAESGTMPNNGTLSSTIDGLNTKSVSIPKGYTDGGTVALDSTIDDTADSQAAQIAEIKAMLEGKSGGSGGTNVETCTVSITATTGIYKLVYTSVESGIVVTKYYELALNTPSLDSMEIVCVQGSAFALVVSDLGNTSTNGVTIYMKDTSKRMLFAGVDNGSTTASISVYGASSN